MENERIARLPKTPVTIAGIGVLQLCGDFESLIEAESHFRSEGHDLNLATAIFDAKTPSAAISSLRQLVPCALRAFHPEITWEEAQALIDRTVARDDPAFVEGVRRMWPVNEASQEIMGRFFERLSPEWKEQFYWQVIAERWPGTARA